MVKNIRWSTPSDDPHQGVLEAALDTIFPTYNIHSMFISFVMLCISISSTLILLLYVIKNARKKVAIKNPHTGGYLEVDVWYPEINLCFEYQVH